MPLDCEALGSHHSKDRVDIFSGSTTPLRTCGFHASWAGAPQISKMKAAQSD